MSNSSLKKRSLSQEDLFNFSELFKLMRLVFHKLLSQVYKFLLVQLKKGHQKYYLIYYFRLILLIEMEYGC